MRERETAPPPSYGTTRDRGESVVSYGQVERAARDLMKIGERPTVRSVIKAMGKGSPNVVADCLRRFWKDTAAMGTGDPLALMRLPPELADAAVAQWAQALRFAQTAVRHDDSAARSRLEELQREADVRVRSVEIREKEWDMAARVLDTALTDVREQLSILLNEQSRDRAAIRAKDGQIAVLQSEVQRLREQMTAMFKKRLARAPSRSRELTRVSAKRTSTRQSGPRSVKAQVRKRKSKLGVSRGRKR